MLQRSYASVGVEEIMERAGVGKSSFYHFFRSKAALGEQVLFAYQKLSEEKILDVAFEKGTPPLKRPLRFVELLTKSLENQDPISGCLIGTFCAEVNSLPEEIQEAVSKVLSSCQVYFERAFSEAVSEMDLLPGTPIRGLAVACCSYVQGLLLSCKANQSLEPLRHNGSLIKNLWSPYLA